MLLTSKTKWGEARGSQKGTGRTSIPVSQCSWAGCSQQKLCSSSTTPPASCAAQPVRAQGPPKDALHFPVNQHPGSHTDLKHCPPHQRPGSTWTHCTAQQPVARDLPKASSLPIFPPANYHPESLLQPRPSLLHHCTLPGPRCASRRGCPCRGDTAHLSPQRAPPRTSTGGSGGWSHPLPAH